jgi:hypothetical protein
LAKRLARYWNAERGIAWPAQDRLARECGCSERTIGKAVLWLAERGFIAIIRRGRANAYAVNWSKAATADRRNSTPGKRNQSSDGKPEPEFRLSESTGLNQSTEQNLWGPLAEGEPQGGRRPVDNAAHSASPSYRCGRSAEDDERPERAEAPEPGFEARSSWQGTTERADELPSVQLVKNLGGKPKVGTTQHDIWRLQRRFEGICEKVGETPFELWEACSDDALRDLLELQAANSSHLGSALLEYVALDYDQRVEFFAPAEDDDDCRPAYQFDTSAEAARRAAELDKELGW